MKNVPQVDLLAAEVIPGHGFTEAKLGDHVYLPDQKIYVRLNGMDDYLFAAEKRNTFTGQMDSWELSPRRHDANCPDSLMYIFTESFGMWEHSARFSARFIPVKRCCLCGWSWKAGLPFIIPKSVNRLNPEEATRMGAHLDCLAGNLHKFPFRWNPLYRDLTKVKPVRFVMEGRGVRDVTVFEVKFLEDGGLVPFVLNVQERKTAEVKLAHRTLTYRLLWEVFRGVRPEVPEFPFAYWGGEE